MLPPAVWQAWGRIVLLCACWYWAWIPSARASCTPSLPLNATLGSCIASSGGLLDGTTCSFGCPLGLGTAPLSLHCPVTGSTDPLVQTCNQCSVGYSLNWTATSLSRTLSTSNASTTAYRNGYSVSVHSAASCDALHAHLLLSCCLTATAATAATAVAIDTMLVQVAVSGDGMKVRCHTASAEASHKGGGEPVLTDVFVCPLSIPSSPCRWPSPLPA